uniref:Uncharacterized protein n=1 Tax=Anguilla anguilla TaxID=7936 RepID=A0A0E9RIM1_ANGAN
MWCHSVALVVSSMSLRVGVSSRHHRNTVCV